MKRKNLVRKLVVMAVSLSLVLPGGVMVQAVEPTEEEGEQLIKVSTEEGQSFETNQEAEEQTEKEQLVEPAVEEEQMEAGQLEPLAKENQSYQLTEQSNQESAQAKESVSGNDLPEEPDQGSVSGNDLPEESDQESAIEWKFFDMSGQKIERAAPGSRIFVAFKCDKELPISSIAPTCTDGDATFVETPGTADSYQWLKDSGFYDADANMGIMILRISSYSSGDVQVVCLDSEGDLLGTGTLPIAPIEFTAEVKFYDQGGNIITSVAPGTNVFVIFKYSNVELEELNTSWYCDNGLPMEIGDDASESIIDLCTPGEDYTNVGLGSVRILANAAGNSAGKFVYEVFEEEKLLGVGWIPINAVTPPQNGGTTPPSAPSPAPAPAASAPTTAAPSQPVVEVSKNTVATTGGTSVTTTVEGVYIADSVNGTVVATPRNEVATAVGVTDTNTKIAFYFCDSRNPVVKENLSNVAKDQGKTVGAYVVGDLYAITGQGRITPVRSASEPVELIFGVPANLQNKVLSIVCIDQTGQVIEFEDTDDVPETITFNANVFGTYAIVY